MNAPGRLFVLFSIIISLSCRAGDKPEQSAPPKGETFVPDTGGRGVIDDRSGYVNVLADKQPDAAVIAKVKTGDPVSFECKVGGKWCRVTLRSGKSGWVPSNRIKLYFTIKDLRKGGDLGEANRKLARRAARGDYDALRKFLSLHLDGAGGEEADAAFGIIVHILGDDAFADFLRGPPPTQVFFNDDITYPFENLEYLHRHFPKTWKALFPREIVKWPSPDGRYAIHKLFSEEGDNGETKVVRAELIEKATGKALIDLTASDIGKGGSNRDGDVLWAPDSKRFAYVSSDLTPMRAGGLKKQTAVFQLTGQAFSKVELPLAEKSGAESDAKLSGATLIHDFVEPVDWLTPTVLKIRRHDYYQTKDESGSSSDSVRVYDITATIGVDGKATIDTKLVEKESY
jgi:Bacterial SH3 domain.